jgi:hypothetical protein
MKRGLIILLTLTTLCYSYVQISQHKDTPQTKQMALPSVFTSIYHSLGGGKSSTRPTTVGKTPVSGAMIYNPSTGYIQQQQGPGLSNIINTHQITAPAGVNNGIYNPPSGNYGGSGVYSGGGGGGGGTGYTDTTGLQNTARDLINSIIGQYHALQGHIAPVIQDKVNQYLQNYDTQTQDLNKAYGNTVGQTQGIMAARGLGDSSFNGAALDNATSDYNQNLGSINQDKSQKLGAIGQYAQGLQSSADTAANQYAQYLPQLGQYSASDLGTLNGQLQSALPGVQAQVGGMGTNQNFLDTLNQYAPQANQGSAQMAQKLQQLVTSSAPIFAKKQIAAGLIKSSQLQDPNAQSYWNDYFSQLLNGS